MKSTKGITLIALVITIIVLLILAGVTIAAITGNESAPNKAVEARNANERGAAKDAATLLVESKIQSFYEDKYVNTNTTNELVEYVSSKLNTGETTGEFTVTVDGDGEITVIKSSKIIAVGELKTNGIIEWDESDDIGGEPAGTITKNEYIVISKKAVAGVGDSTNKDDWKVLYDARQDEDPEISGYLYVILADYLPNETRISLGIHTELLTDNTKYNIYMSGKYESHLLTAKLVDNVWNNLIDSKAQDKGIIVKGALPYRNGLSDIKAMKKIEQKRGENYVPHNSIYQQCNGYYMASNPGNGGLDVVNVDGGTGEGKYNKCLYGVCPVAKIPANVKLVRKDGVLTVK